MNNILSVWGQYLRKFNLSDLSKHLLNFVSGCLLLKEKKGDDSIKKKRKEKRKNQKDCVEEDECLLKF
jgi:hypothetical protein